MKGLLLKGFLIWACFVAGAFAEDAGDEFANNLFSDLAPSVPIRYQHAQNSEKLTLSQDLNIIWRESDHAVHQPVNRMG